MGHYLTDLKKPVKAAVEDAERRDAVLDISKDLGKELKGTRKDVQQAFDAYVEVHARPDAQPTDFERVTQRLVKEHAEYARRVLDARDAMRDEMTEAEWELVFGKSH